ncbi:hypothetical protein CSUI_010156 [Cystoisospora suis]|uniref:Uncharacterized protein n=1 Tax=Cystoisospora suis TaxID=483139 RepID=A0A2C6KHN1_9APIC|nr:hypothetical protein CSUI_010156 [Cystoisospora suis]
MHEPTSSVNPPLRPASSSPSQLTVPTMTGGPAQVEGGVYSASPGTLHRDGTYYHHGQATSQLSQQPSFAPVEGEVRQDYSYSYPIDPPQVPYDPSYPYIPGYGQALQNDSSYVFEPAQQHRYQTMSSHQDRNSHSTTSHLSGVPSLPNEAYTIQPAGINNTHFQAGRDDERLRGGSMQSHSHQDPGGGDPPMGAPSSLNPGKVACGYASYTSGNSLENFPYDNTQALRKDHLQGLPAPPSLVPAASHATSKMATTTMLNSHPGVMTDPPVDKEQDYLTTARHTTTTTTCSSAGGATETFLSSHSSQQNTSIMPVSTTPTDYPSHLPGLFTEELFDQIDVDGTRCVYASDGVYLFSRAPESDSVLVSVYPVGTEIVQREDGSFVPVYNQSPTPASAESSGQHTSVADEYHTINKPSNKVTNPSASPPSSTRQAFPTSGNSGVPTPPHPMSESLPATPPSSHNVPQVLPPQLAGPSPPPQLPYLDPSYPDPLRRNPFNSIANTHHSNAVQQQEEELKRRVPQPQSNFQNQDRHLSSSPAMLEWRAEGQKTNEGRQDHHHYPSTHSLPGQVPSAQSLPVPPSHQQQEAERAFLRSQNHIQSSGPTSTVSPSSSGVPSLTPNTLGATAGMVENNVDRLHYHPDPSQDSAARFQQLERDREQAYRQQLAATKPRGLAMEPGRALHSTSVSSGGSKLVEFYIDFVESIAPQQFLCPPGTRLSLGAFIHEEEGDNPHFVTPTTLMEADGVADFGGASLQMFWKDEEFVHLRVFEEVDGTQGGGKESTGGKMRKAIGFIKLQICSLNSENVTMKVMLVDKNKEPNGFLLLRFAILGDVLYNASNHQNILQQQTSSEFLKEEEIRKGMRNQDGGVSQPYSLNQDSRDMTYRQINSGHGSGVHTPAPQYQQSNSTPALPFPQNTMGTAQPGPKQPSTTPGPIQGVPTSASMAATYPLHDGHSYPGGTNSAISRNICASFYEGKMDSRNLHEITPLDSVVDEGYDAHNTLLPVVPLGFPGLPPSYQHETRKQMLPNNYSLDIYGGTEGSPSSSYGYHPQDTSSRDRRGARGRKPLQQGIAEEKESLGPHQGMPVIHYDPNRSGSSSSTAASGGVSGTDSASVKGVPTKDSQPLTRSPQAKTQKKTRRVRHPYACKLCGVGLVRG